MSADASLREHLHELHHQEHNLLGLLLRPGVLGISVLVETSLIADADGATVEGAANPDIYLSEELCASTGGRKLFMKLLLEAKPYVCRKLTLEQKKTPAQKYDGWSWWHLKQAFASLDFLADGISDKDFFTFLSLVLPGRSYSSISQGFYCSEYSKSDGIVEIVMEEFRLVAEIMVRDR